MRHRINDLKQFPRCFQLGVRPQDWLALSSYPKNPHHESILRSYQTLEYVKELLVRNTPADTILEILQVITEMPDCEPYLLTPKEGKE